MRKFISVSCIVFFGIIYLVSSNDYLMKKIAPYRYELSSIFGSDKYMYGDLYGLTNVSDFKIKPEKKYIQNSDCIKPGNINLYMLCDSYLWGFVKTDSIFCNVNKLEYVRWLYNEQISEQLDTSFSNVLIIETTERIVRKILRDTIEIYSSLNIYKNNSEKIIYREPETIWGKINRYMFNKKINQNIEFNLFDYRFITPLKELKADFNYIFFNRVNNDAAVSTDKKYLFYYETTDSTKKSSSFNPISDQEIYEIVSSINSIYNHFKSLGFDQVYLSIIPNPVTIIDPDFGKHNNLINRIQNNSDLVIPLINILPLFKMASNELYYHSDSHWNYDGFQIWVNETNKILKQFNKNNIGIEKK